MKLLIALIISISFQTKAFSKDAFTTLFNLSNVKNEFNHKKTIPTKTTSPDVQALIKPVTKNIYIKEPFKLLVISNSNLYLQLGEETSMSFKNIYGFSPYDSNFVESPFYHIYGEQERAIVNNYIIPKPIKNTSTLFDHSQLILQETIRDVLVSLKKEAVDALIFAGNDVYSNDQLAYFDEITADLNKYQVPYYQILGQNENRGTNKDTDKYFKDKFYLLKSKSTNIVILDNVHSNPVPARIPEEATEQYLWIKSLFTKFNENKSPEDLIIISHNKLDKNTIDFINSFTNLNLKLVINSESGQYQITDKDTGFTLASNPIVISNPGLSIKPCGYLSIKRNLEGRFEIKRLELPSLKAICS